MNFLQKLALFSLVCFGYGRPQSPTAEDDTNVPIMDENSETHFGNLKDFKDIEIPPIADDPAFNLTNDGSGNYYFSFDDYPLARSEVGELKNAGTDNEIQTVRGQYVIKEMDAMYDIIFRTIGYVADENGFRPFLISVRKLIGSDFLKFEVGPGAPQQKTEISSATLGSLIGGNLG